MVWPSLHNLLFIMTKEAMMYYELKNKLQLVDKTSKSIVDGVLLLQNMDFSPLLEHPADWAEQMEISEDYAQLLDATFVHYNADVGLVLCFLGGKLCSRVA